MLVLFVWVANAGVLYFSVYILAQLFTACRRSGRDLELAHIYSVGRVCGQLCLLLLLMKYILRAHNTASKRYWKFYHYLIILTGCLVIGATSSIRSAPEFVIARSFYNIFVKDVKIDLPPYVLAN